MSEEKVEKVITVAAVATKQTSKGTLFSVQEEGGPAWVTFNPGRGNAAVQYEGSVALIKGTVKTKDNGYTDYYLDEIKPAPAAEVDKAQQAQAIRKQEVRAKDVGLDLRACIAIAARSFQGLNSASPKDEIKNHGLRVIALARHYFDAVQLARAEAEPKPEPEPEPELSAHDDGIPF